jgi:hypothetical protein
MNLFKNALCLSAALLLATLPARAQAHPAEQLLPDDTIGLLTVQDWQKMASFQKESAWGRLWDDPAMKPFREHFTTNFKKDVIEPLEKELGLKLSDYNELLQGQITLAITPPAEGSANSVGALLLIDVKDKTNLLSAKISEFNKRWSESGKELKTEKVRDVEFSTVAIRSKDIEALMKRVFPEAEPKQEGDEDQDKAPSKPLVLRIGQVKNLLIIGENPKVIEKVLAKLNGGLVTALAEQPNFQKCYQSMFRDALGYGWLNFKPIYQKILEAASKSSASKGPQESPSLEPAKLLPLIGLEGLESLSVDIHGNAEGAGFEFLVGVPEARKEGIFKILAFENKESSPPSFVPADAIKFQRWRVDLKKGWENAEALLGKIEPSLAGMVQLMLSSAGKQKDPNFDLKKNLIDNLGDDIITYEKAPKTFRAVDLQSPPSIVLISSPNPGELLDAVRMLVSLAPGPISTAPVKEREFLGKKIYTLGENTPPPSSGPGETNAPGRSLNFTASNGYLAFSADPAILEEFLRSAENTGKSLREMPGLAEAARKIGGTELGLLTFENQKESLRTSLEVLKNDPEGYRRSLFFGAQGAAEAGAENRMSRWFDVKLLPSYDAISKYFGIFVITGASTAEGLDFRGFAPMPAAFRQ